MKYKFTKVDDDTTELTYKDKKFVIRKDVELMTKLESIKSRAKILMTKELKDMGMTIQDLEIERKEGSKTYVDKSNVIAVEKEFIDRASNQILSEITQKYTNMGLAELLEDIEINISEQGLEEQQKFIYDFLVALRGEKNPSKVEIKPV